MANVNWNDLADGVYAISISTVGVNYNQPVVSPGATGWILNQTSLDASKNYVIQTAYPLNTGVDGFPCTWIRRRNISAEGWGTWYRQVFIISSGVGITGSNYINGWYRQWSDGWIEQGGTYVKATGTSSTYNSIVLVFPIAFTKNTYTFTKAIAASSTSATASYSAAAYASGTKTPTQITTGAENYSTGFDFEVKGY